MGLRGIVVGFAWCVQLSAAGWLISAASNNPLDNRVTKRSNCALIGRIAQLVEQRIENPRVDGSIPSPATTAFTLTPLAYS